VSSSSRREERCAMVESEINEELPDVMEEMEVEEVEL
jgi:hypothetical protein